MSKCAEIYCKYFGHGDQDFIPCEIPGCPNQSGPPHHILFKSLGGKDEIENLMGLCMPHHDKAHTGKLKRDYLKRLHLKFMQRSIYFGSTIHNG